MSRLPFLYSEIYLVGVMTYSLAYCHAWWAREGTTRFGIIGSHERRLMVWAATLTALFGVAIFALSKSRLLSYRCGRVTSVCLLVACVLLTWPAPGGRMEDAFMFCTLPLLFGSLVSLHFVMRTLESHRWPANLTTALLLMIAYGVILNLRITHGYAVYPSYAALFGMIAAVCVLISVRILIVWVASDERGIRLRELFLATALIAVSLLGFVTRSNIMLVRPYPLLKKDREQYWRFYHH